ncbi:Rab11 [Hexamita inflata]|uniref:Rab11 n=1 Tax=Hexamita inflata TaxID=28002 RepID=A0AA86V774_9EUKA|nr:Rab11 [Hexamita inflata]
MNPDYDYQIKIVFTGAQQSGKTYTLNKITDRNEGQIDLYVPTIGVDFVIKRMQVTVHKKIYNIKLQLWDTAGSERFKTIVNVYYRNALGIFLFCDVCKQGSFKKCSELIEQIKEYNQEDAQVMLVGNQIGTERVVSVDELVTFAQNNNIMFAELNIDNSENANDILERMVKCIIHQILLDVENGKQTKQGDGVLI